MRAHTSRIRPPKIGQSKGFLPIKGFFANEEIQRHDKVVEIQKGDTLSELAMKVYGRYFNGNIHNKIRLANPQVSNLNNISPGQKIIFPDAPLVQPPPKPNKGADFKFPENSKRF